ncbi:MAG: MinD/ParA family protein [Chloroflexi bacterium]|nr:MinD/ParA family protein [Chloroflexota bacterium]MCI0580744.1 MinD/ParA family protein [Chloroflexota bacterium]MCI0650015.1 MinD/ParA family protein [Chloroflexota bacterium]MCI0730479.1 MinD/ParA family protein [Chloroflexota bacterium]
MGKIVSIHSFRGGTGKSNTTANLAAQIALAGKRVGVVDTDIQSPGIHVLFGLDEEKMGRTLNEYLRGECSIEEVAMHVGSHVGEAQGRQKLIGKDLWLIPSSINGREISEVVRHGYDVNRLNAGLQTARKVLNLDYLFIDTHPGLNEETLLSIAFSDILIIILRPDQQDFQGTAVTVDIARSLDVPHLFLVVNKALTRYDFNQIRETVGKIYSAPVAGVMPLTEDMVDLQSADIFSLRFPNHPWSQAIRGVAQRILEVP